MNAASDIMIATQSEQEPKMAELYVVFCAIKQSFAEEALEELDSVDAESNYESVQESDSESEQDNSYDLEEKSLDYAVDAEHDMEPEFLTESEIEFEDDVDVDGVNLSERSSIESDKELDSVTDWRVCVYHRCSAERAAQSAHPLQCADRATVDESDFIRAGGGEQRKTSRMSRRWNRQRLTPHRLCRPMTRRRVGRAQGTDERRRQGQHSGHVMHLPDGQHDAVVPAPMPNNPDRLIAEIFPKIHEAAASFAM